MTTTTTPKSRVIPDLSFEDYLELDGVSQSALKRMERGPEHVRHYQDNPAPPKKPQELGSAIHVALLESDRWADCYAAGPDVTLQSERGKALWEAARNPKGWREVVVCGPEGSKQTNAWKDAKKAIDDGQLLVPPAEFEECEQTAKRVAGRIPLSPADYATCLAMADTVLDKDRSQAAQWLLAQGDTELSVQWHDPDTGVLCKLRADRAFTGPRGRVIVDLKSTVNVHPPAFLYQARKFRYDIQGAFYRDGLTIATGEPHDHYLIVAVEKEAPYWSKVFPLSDATYQAARDDYKRWLEQYAKAQASGVWADSGEVVEL